MVGFETFFNKRVNTKFVVRNIAPGNKCLHLFMYPINNGDTRDLLDIPTVSEADLRHSLLKGELLVKFLAHELEVVESTIDLLQFDPEQLAFLQSIGITTGLEVVVPPPIDQTLQVAKSGAQYTSVKDAVDAITDASSVKPYVIQVYPGLYVESPFAAKPYVTIRGVGDLYGVILQTNDNNTHFITGDVAADISNLSIIGPTSVGCAAVNFESVGVIPFVLNKITIMAGYYGVWCHPSAGEGVLHCLQVSNYFIGSNIQEFMRVTDHGFMVGISCSAMSGPANSIMVGYRASGPDSTLSLDACTFLNAGNTDGLLIDDGTNVKTIGCAFTQGLNAIHVGSTGSGTILRAAGLVIRNDFTYDFLVDTPLCNIAFQGIANKDKLSIPNGTPFVASFVDRESAEPGKVVIGELWLGHTGADSFPLGSYSYSSAVTGLASGGTVIEGPGLVVNVGAGVGYINTGTSVTRVTWDPIVIPVTAELDRAWIIVDATGTVQESLFRPDPTLVISLCSYATNDHLVVGISKYINDITQIAPKLAIYDRDVMGPMCVSGGIVTKHAGVSLELDVTAATYYVYFTRQVTSGQSPLTFTYWRRSPISGWIKEDGYTSIDTNYYDNSGTLTLVPGGKYKRDCLYVTQDSSTEEYHVVYGQELFDGVPPGDSLINPTPPDFLNQAACRLAAIVTLSGAVDIEAVIDQRPFNGQFAAASTGVTRHGDLLDLGLDQHPQYQLRSEENQVSGYCGLNVSAQVAAAQLPLTAVPPTNVDATAAVVGASNEIARANHKHNISVAAPVTIGTANALGISTSLALADHVHAHGAQISPTDHALSTALASGFMSAAQFTRLSNTIISTMMWGNDGVSSTTATRFLAPGYLSSTAHTTAIQFRCPCAGTLKNFYVHHNSGAGNGNAIVYTIMINNIASTLTISMASTAADGSDLVHTVAVAQGDLIDIRVTKELSVGTSPTNVLATLALAQ